MKSTVQSRNRHSTLSTIFTILILILWGGVDLAQAQGQWTTNGNNINNTNSGNVGIGTTTPTSILNVKKDSIAASQADGYGISLTNTTAANGTITAQYSPPLLWTGRGWASSLSTSKALTFRSYVQPIAGGLNPSGNLLFERSIGGSSYFNILTLASGGNVGIGTGSPGYKLDVQGGQLNVSGGLCIAGDCKTTWSQVGGSQWTTTGSNVYYNSGNVGIGTGSPGYKLDVQGGQLNVSGGLCIAGDCKTTWSQVGGSTTLSAANVSAQGFGANTGGGSYSFPSNLTVSGDLYLPGAGSNFFSAGTGDGATYSTFNFALNGWWGMALKDYSGTVRGVYDFRSGNLTTDGVANFQGSGNNSFTGNVGIGTTSPVNKLDVAPGAGDGIKLRSTGADTNTSDLTITNMGISVITGGWTLPNTFMATFGNPSGQSGGDSGGSLMTVSHTLDNNTNSLLTLYNRNQAGLEQHGYFLKATGASSSDKFWLNAGGSAFFAGNVTVTGNIAAKYQDVAEWVPSTEALSAGTVVIVDPAKSNHVVSSSQAYDTRVAGVISAQPGLTLGEGGAGKVLVATTGRVRIKVDARSAPIQIGDLLVTSDIEGLAMKSEPLKVGGRLMHMPGTLIGKALETLEKGTGEILVLLSLQ